MLVSLKNIKEYVSLEGLTAEEIANGLTFAGSGAALYIAALTVAISHMSKTIKSINATISFPFILLIPLPIFSKNPIFSPFFLWIYLYYKITFL